jgi:hypothetical protein
MGTALRFAVGLIGLIFVAAGLALVAPTVLDIIITGEDVDFPGGAVGIIALLLVAGSFPLVFGGYLLRKAFALGARSSVTPASEPVQASEIVAAVAIPERPATGTLDDVGARMSDAAMRHDVAPVDTLPPPSPQQARPRPRRIWLAVFGLCVTLPGLVVVLLGLWEMTFGLTPPEQRTDPGVTVMIVIIGTIPVAVGLWLARTGDPGMGPRFVEDVRSRIETLRNKPSALLALGRTSVGLALAIAIITLPLLFVWREAAPITAMWASMLFSVADPVLNVSRRSWWLGAFISVSVWFALLLTVVAVADAISPMREGTMIFMLPMMLYPMALGLSGFARLWRWAWRRSIPARID